MLLNEIFKRTRYAVLAVSLAVLAMLPGFIANHALAAGNTYYVSPSGSDSNDGLSPQTAWQSINQVNSTWLNPGDTVLFQGGSTFNGEIYVQPGENGSAASPITFGSYGTGNAMIDGGNSSAFFAYDAGGIAMNNLTVVGDSGNIGDGISFYNDLSGNVKLNYLNLNNLDVSHFGSDGISIGGYNGASGYSNVSVTYSNIHDNGVSGLITYGPAFNPSSPAYALSNVYVGHVYAYNNSGNASQFGNGVALGSVQTGTLESSVAYNNAFNSAGGVGLWTYDSTGITIQYNESYNNHTSGKVDGDGFDLDQNTSNSYLQYNYAHNNDGAGFLDWGNGSSGPHNGNTIRYNISQNDGRKNSYGGIYAGGYISNDNIYGNDVYMSSSTSGSPSAVVIYPYPTSSTVLGLTLRNNILYTTSGLAQVNSPALSTSMVIFQENDYYSSFKAIWGTSTYTAIASWRNTGQEKLSGVAKGLTSNPALANAGGGGTINNPDQLAQLLPAYKLNLGSSMVGQGLDLKKQFGINMGGHDFYGISVPSSTGRVDLGANQRQ